MVCTRYVISSGRKKRSANFQSVVPYWRVVTEFVWADRPVRLLAATTQRYVWPERGPVVVGFIWSDRKHRRFTAQRASERASGGGSGSGGGRRISRITLEGRDEWDKDRWGVWDARQELKDEDMHINRETSTEMSDHR